MDVITLILEYWVLLNANIGAIIDYNKIIKKTKFEKKDLSMVQYFIFGSQRLDFLFEDWSN